MKYCHICNVKLGNTFSVREMMLGFGNKFEYAQCISCNTIQIIDIPKDMEVYYPHYYYSFKQNVAQLFRLPFFKRLFHRSRVKRKYKNNGADGFKYLKPLQILFSQKILDIGCGKGKLICDMFNLGFTNIEGVDKYIDREYDYGYGVKVFKKDLSELEKDSYDLLMMHHVFEHMEQPSEDLLKCYDLLKKDGNLIIRIPIVGKAWEVYKEDWVQIDAPRHFYIYTVESMKIMADKTGFKIDQVIYDSSSFGFLGSELYKRDISLIDQDSKEPVKMDDHFSAEELTAYQTLAEELNQNEQGDQAIFYLSKIAK